MTLTDRTIRIWWDSPVDGACFSYGENLYKQGRGFKTNIPYFFNGHIYREFIKAGGDDIVVFRDGYKKISIKTLYENNGDYTSKEIRQVHDINKLLMGGKFWVKNDLQT